MALVAVGQRAVVRNGVQEVNGVTPQVRAWHHAHAVVFVIDIVESDPSGHFGHRFDDRAQQNIPVPTCSPRRSGELVPDPVVPDAEFSSAGELGYSPGNLRVGNKMSAEGFADLPDVDDLPEVLPLLTRPALADDCGLGDVIVVALCDDAHNLAAQLLDGGVVEEHTTVEESVGFQLSDLPIRQHGAPRTQGSLAERLHAGPARHV